MAPLPPSKGEMAGLSGESSAPVLTLMLGRGGGGGARVAAGPRRGTKDSCAYLRLYLARHALSPSHPVAHARTRERGQATVTPTQTDKMQDPALFLPFNIL